MGVSGKSTILVWNYRKVLELTGISGPSEARDLIDVTNHDSANGFREFVAGPVTGGEIAVEGNFVASDSAGQITLHTDMQGGTSRTAWIVAPMSVGAALSFTAFAKGFDMSFPYDNKLGISGSLQVSGKPTLYTTQSTGISALTGIKGGGGALTITPTPAAGTYAYACSVDTGDDHIHLTVTAATHTVYVQGALEATGVQTAAIALGAAGTITDVFIMVYEANKAPRIYILTVTRPAA